MVGVAQLVEHRIVIPVVVGSIPIVHPINYTQIRGRGEIGRRAGLRIQYREVWEFKSLRPHQIKNLVNLFN